MTDIDAGELAKRRPYDWAPLLLVPLLALAALPLIGSLSTWATLTAAGLAMGMIIFIIASGLTLVFGLMDVLNFGHGAFISVGAYVAAILLAPLSGLLQADSLVLNGVALLALIALAMTATGLLGWAFERIIIMPVYGQHLKQILVTVGGMIVAQQLIIVLWGPVQLAFPLPTAFRGAIVLGDVAIERYRIIAVIVGLVVFAGMLLVLNRTKIGLLIRAGVENREMVEALGYHIRRLFVGVLPRGAHPRHGHGSAGAGLHRGDHRRAGIDRRLLHRLAAGRGHRQLRRLPGAEGGARVQHHADGADPAVALARPLSGGEPMTMLRAILSGDYPQSRMLSAALLVIFFALAAAPFLFPGTQSLNVAAKICYFVVLAASYDLLLGYTGIVSFAHTMFFGIGGYGAGLALYTWGPTWTSVLIGTLLGLGLAIVLALIIGLFSLRVRAIFFAMITLAVASAFAILASQLSWLTGGEDGRTFRVPEVLRPGYSLLEAGAFSINGRIITYYLIFLAALVLFLGMLRVVNSPFGRVLQGIRENEFRAEALGYRTIVYRSIVNCLSAAMATLAGVLAALWLRYTGPAVTLSFDIMLDILLMVVIGGMGTLYGAVIGATIFILAENYLQALMGALSKSAAGLPVLPQLFDPDRWLLWLGVLFVLSVYFFPAGIVGKLAARK